MHINKSFATNGFSVLLIGISYLFNDPFDTPVLYMGLFALSGALTNAIAVHMLFEKVPFLYGSGVITQNFEAFKRSIKELMMREFFTQQNLQRFLEQEEKRVDLEPIIEKTDFSPAYDALAKTVMESSFGGMLGMFGGEKVIEGLRSPFESKMKAAVKEIAKSEAFQNNLNETLSGSSLSMDLNEKIESAINARMDELDAQMVKEMVQRIIAEHLGWLVVWGGVFGAVIGLISAVLIVNV